MDPSWHFYDPQPQSSSASVACQSHSRATMKSPLSTCINANKPIDKERMIIMPSEESPRTSKPTIQSHSVPRSPSYVQHDFSRQPSRLLRGASQKKPEYTNRGSVPLQERSLENSRSTYWNEKSPDLPLYHTNSPTSPRGRKLFGLNMPQLAASVVLFVYCVLFLRRTVLHLRANDLAADVFAYTHEKCNALQGVTTGTYLDRIATLQSTLDLLQEEDEQHRRQVWISEPSASSSYYTAISQKEWHLSERPFLFIVESSPVQVGHNIDLKILTPQFEEDRGRILPYFGIPHRETPKEWALERKQSAVETILHGDDAYTIEYIAWPEETSPYEILASHLAKTSVDSEEIRIHLDPGVRSFISSGVTHALGKQVAIDIAHPKVLSIRERKSREEIALLECANQFTLQAIKKTRELIKFGMTEHKVSEILQSEFESLGMPDGEGLVLFGENAALPHGSGTGRVLTDKDLILIDAGGTFKGYVSDITRTFALKGSKISKTQERLWETVKSAQKAALDAAVLQNATGASIDAAARSVIEDLGTRPEEKHGFSHRLGHGIGLEGHESPFLVGSNDQPILPGNTFSDEPGIYIVGELGVRLEDCWILEEDAKGNRKARMFTGPASSLYQL